MCDLLVATRRYRVNFELSTRTINEVFGNKKCEPLIMKRKSDVFTIFARQYCNWNLFFLHSRPTSKFPKCHMVSNK